jgi:1-acyl-sn-glycerol-3-phosphate acyltransferase
VPASETAAARLARRARTIPLCIALCAAGLALLPLLLAAALAVDLVRRDRLVLLRLVAFAAVYGVAEVVGLAASLAVWAAHALGAGRARYLTWNRRLQRAWTRALLAALRRLFALRLVVEDAELAAGGPLLVLPRHASLADVLLPAVLVADPERLRLRWVLKRELLADPCLDVVGQRLPNAFVDRSAEQSEREIAAIAELGRGLGARDGVLIYPEGSRATPGGRERALARIAAGSQPGRLAALAGLRHLLPPRSGGTLALLAAAPGADVLVIGHAGLDGLARLRDLLSPTLVGRTLRVRFWRHAAASVPREAEAALAWLDARWRELDDWVESALAAAAAR